MIIVTIGNINMKLASLADAEALMQIAARAECVNEEFDENYKPYFRPIKDCSKIKIEIVDDSRMASEETHQSIVQTKADNRAKAAAEGGAACQTTT